MLKKRGIVTMMREAKKYRFNCEFRHINVIMAFIQLKILIPKAIPKAIPKGKNSLGMNKIKDLY
jgi:hypothetical protein